MILEGEELVRCVGLCKRFGGTRALDNVDLALPSCGIVAIVGPNGAGKSTLLDVITGFVRPDAGRCLVGGHDVTNLAPYRIARLGIARTFQDVRLARQLSVTDNLLAAGQSRKKEGLVYSLLRPRKSDCATPAVTKIMDRMGIRSKALEQAGSLSFGQQKILSLAMCVISGPRALFLDEPIAGVDFAVEGLISKFLVELAAESRLVCIIEHNLEFVRRVADSVIVLDHGKVATTGPVAEIFNGHQLGRIFMG